MKKIFFALFFSVFIVSACTEEGTITQNGQTDTITTATIENAKTYDVSKFEEYKLQEVIDGDTIRINYKGGSEKIRFLLIDTPETNHKTLGEQPYGQEAKQFLKKLLEEQDTVYLEFDVSYRDKYKRLLAYIYTKDGISVQEQLLKSGLARVAYIYAPNTKHVDWFKSIQKEAQKSAIGVWSVEDYVTNRGFDKEAYYAATKESKDNPVTKKDESNTTNENGCIIKGNINAKGNKIYHMPGQKDYENTVAEEMFCTESDAKQAGFIPAAR